MKISYGQNIEEVDFLLDLSSIFKLIFSNFLTEHKIISLNSQLTACLSALKPSTGKDVTSEFKHATSDHIEKGLITQHLIFIP